MSKRAPRTALLFSLALLSLPTTLITGTALIVALDATHLCAQSKPKERTVDGKVVNKAESPLAGSVVYLKDTKSLNIKTYICDDAGLFHFGSLSQNTDYELWAASNGTKSKTKSISSFDDKNNYYFILTIN